MIFAKCWENGFVQVKPCSPIYQYVYRSVFKFFTLEISRYSFVLQGRLSTSGKCPMKKIPLSTTFCLKHMLTNMLTSYRGHFSVCYLCIAWFCFDGWITSWLDGCPMKKIPLSTTFLSEAHVDKHADFLPRTADSVCFYLRYFCYFWMFISLFFIIFDFSHIAHPIFLFSEKWCHSGTALFFRSLWFY